MKKERNIIMVLTEVTSVSDELASELKLDKDDKLYGCYIDDKIIGYAIIRNDLEERVYLEIIDEYQGNGYGSTAFKELLLLINGTVKCSVSFDNIKMQRIILKNNGIETGRDGHAIHYVIE